MHRTRPICARLLCCHLLTLGCMALLLLAWPLAQVLPPQAGWENHLLENAQLFILLIGLGMALGYAYRATSAQKRQLFLALALIWLVLAARELSWGACILLPGEMGSVYTGPIYSSNLLWYKPAVYPLVLALLAWSLFWLIRARFWHDVLMLMRTRRIPWLDLLLCLAALAYSTWAEGHLPGLNPPPEAYAVLLEELAETAAYLALLTGQWRALLALQPPPGSTPSH